MSGDEPTEPGMQLPEDALGQPGQGRDTILPRARPVHETVVPALEAMLFASGDPVKTSALAEVLEVEEAVVELALGVLEDRLEARGSGLQLARVAKGVQLRTHPRHAELVLGIVGGRPTRLSRAALEVLSIVAYQQPVTRGDVEDIRGVACGAVMKHLLERGVLRVVGRREVPGRPLEYGTSDAFLELFGLDTLKDLPTLAERAALEEDLDGGA